MGPRTQCGWRPRTRGARRPQGSEPHSPTLSLVPTAATHCAAPTPCAARIVSASMWWVTRPLCIHSRRFPCNMVALVDGTPKQLGLKDFLRHFVDFR